MNKEAETERESVGKKKKKKEKGKKEDKVKDAADIGAGEELSEHEKLILEFKSIGYEMAKKAKAHVKSIRRKGDEEIARLNKELVDRLRADLRKMTAEYIRDFESKLNSMISDNIRMLARKIVEKKKALFEDYKKELLNRIARKIGENREKYIEIMLESLGRHLDVIGKNIIIRTTENDRELAEKARKMFPDREFREDEPISGSVGGYILRDPEGRITVDNTVETLVSLKEDILEKEFATIFPPYEDTRKSATELMREHHFDRFFREPEELRKFIEENNVM